MKRADIVLQRSEMGLDTVKRVTKNKPSSKYRPLLTSLTFPTT